MEKVINLKVEIFDLREELQSLQKQYETVIKKVNDKVLQIRELQKDK